MNRILWNRGRKEIDEIVLHDVQTVHVEQMDDRVWWMGITLNDGSYWSGNFSPKSFTEQESDVTWEEDREHV